MNQAESGDVGDIEDIERYKEKDIARQGDTQRGCKKESGSDDR